MYKCILNSMVLIAYDAKIKQQVMTRFYTYTCTYDISKLVYVIGLYDIVLYLKCSIS